jgi:multidrug efflux pump subunit AcrA (membrane-fusion protein)
LFLEFDDAGLYNNSTWQVTIPNLRSGSYTTYKNAFELAVRQKDQNIRAAEDALAIALNEATARNAAPRVESLVKANATVQAAEAKIAAIDAQIANASIAAPFTGTITDVSIVSGETANLNPVITILGNTPFTLTARVPEIDITKIFINQTALVAFDAKSDETFTGVVSFVSPLPTTIDGVAYFDATITLTDIPTWIRAGLNADVDITLKRETDVLRVPERFLTTASEGYTVRLASSKTATPTLVEVLFIGNDGYASITGLNEGDIIIAPEK